VAKKEPPFELDVGGRVVRVTSPGKVYFPDLGVTKIDLIRYYLAVAEGALRGVARRPIVLKRYVNGIGADFFFQKRAPEDRPDWIETVTLRYPSGRSADEIVVTEAAQLAWMVNLGNIDLNPHAVRVDDLEHPDELRVDLDPMPGASWADVRRVALVAREVLEEHGLQGFPKTSGSRGLHVLVRLEPRFGFGEVRRAAQALAREVERRAPNEATAKWWKEERHGVFVDFNQNAKDRTVCSAYSVRPVPDARVSAPLAWDEVPVCELGDFTLSTMPERFAELGDLHAGIDDAPGSLDGLLALADRHEAEGLTAGEPSPKKKAGARGRQSKMPLVTVAQAKKKEDALAGLERWKARHPAAAALLGVDDVLVDAMRGRSSAWYRVRVNLRNVPEAERPPEEPPDPDYDVRAEWRGPRP
jgi:bifunctional non-homologous end joining protein LigD